MSHPWSDRMADGARGPWQRMLLAFALTLAAGLLALPLRVGNLTVFWPAAGVIPGLLLVSQGRGRAATLAGAAAALVLASLIGGRSLDMVALFLVANLVQALVITVLLERLLGRPCRLHTLGAIGVFFAVGALVPLGVSGLVSAGLMATGRTMDSPGAVWITIFASHVTGVLTVTPALLALHEGPRAIGREPGERWRAVAMLAAFSTVALALIGLGEADDSRVLVATFALLYPFALWLASRTSPSWCALALVALTVVVVGCTVADVGLFAGQVALAQLFLLVCAAWLLTLGQVLERLRASLERAVRSEAALRDSLRAGGAFTYDWRADTDVVVREGQQPILGTLACTTGRQYAERVHPDDRAAFEAAAFGLRPDEPNYVADYRYQRDDGRVVWIQERGRGEFDAGGRLRRLQGVSVDVTARRQAEQALREADQRKDVFLATLAHELRNPLAPLRSGLELIATAGQDAATRQRTVAVMRRQLTHLVRLVDDLLDVSRITTGKLRLQREPLDLAALVDEAVHDAMPLAVSLEHRLQVRVDDGPWQADGDPVRLMQVVLNLLHNALRYTPRGGRVDLRLQREGDTALLSVRDNGIGIPADKLEQVFELFAQVQGPHGYQSQGLGIGLNLSRRLVTMHGGSLTVASEGAGRGSVFTVRLPLRPPAAALPGPPPRAAAEPAVDTLRVLVVDDMADSADSLGLLLESCGHTVAIAHSGAQALARLEGFDAQLALIDIGMPGMSGLELAQALRGRPQGRRMMLVALSGWSRAEDRARSLAAGFDAHLVKPLDLAALEALLAARAAD